MVEEINPAVPILANRYQLLQTLGSGGMAVVYRAKDLNLERFVSVKILRPDFSKDEGFRKRFHQEAKSAANLSHPNIVTVHDFGLDGDRLFIIMEYVPGTNLKTIIREREFLPFEEALELMIQASAGIGYAHRAGLVHCDIKPHNMLVTPDGRLKVTDFGIARAVSSIKPDEKNSVIWGSPQYLSPEQASGEPPSPASDVYSLGVVFYELITGRLPFYSKDTTELTRLHKEVMPVPPRVLKPDIPMAYEEIILKILSKEPVGRYRTAEQLKSVLENLKIQKTVISPQTYTSSPQTTYHSQPDSISKVNSSKTFDWGTALLGLITFLLAGGLIPFWLFIWFSLNSSR